LWQRKRPLVIVIVIVIVIIIILVIIIIIKRRRRRMNETGKSNKGREPQRKKNFGVIFSVYINII